MGNGEGGIWALPFGRQAMVICPSGVIWPAAVIQLSFGLRPSGNGHLAFGRHLGFARQALVIWLGASFAVCCHFLRFLFYPQLAPGCWIYRFVNRNIVKHTLILFILLMYYQANMNQPLNSQMINKDYQRTLELIKHEIQTARFQVVKNHYKRTYWTLLEDWKNNFRKAKRTRLGKISCWKIINWFTKRFYK